MLFNNERKINKTIEDLKLSDTLEGIIHQRYNALGNWLNRMESSIKQYGPVIYPQGSVRTGTVIKPLDGGAYDVDIVCELQMESQTISPMQFKEMIGKEIEMYMKQYSFNEKIINARKCWTVEYCDNVSFHIDILPAIKKETKDTISTDIMITNKDLPKYSSVPGDWEESNPKGFAKWLKDKELQIFTEIENSIKLTKKLESIPEHKVLTPLRKTIMLLKRHRDIFFQFENQDFRPASVIITTLSGMFYEKNPFKTTEETLKSIISQFSTYTKNIQNTSFYSLQSPSSQENFLDKWNTNKNFKKYFELWVNKLSEDISDIKYFLNSCKDSEKLTNDELDIFLLEQKHTKWKFEECLALNITCEIHQAENTCYIPHCQQKRIKNRDIVSKNIKIKFIAKTNISREEDFKVYWRVINTGASAFQSKCLRGDMFCNSSNIKSLTRIELTGYSGVHSIEAFIILKEKIIAKSSPFIIKIK